MKQHRCLVLRNATLIAAVLLLAGGCADDDGAPLFGATEGSGATTGSASGTGGNATSGSTTAAAGSTTGTSGSSTAAASTTGAGGSSTASTTGASSNTAAASTTGTGGSSTAATSTTGTGGSSTGSGGGGAGAGGSSTGSGGSGAGGASSGMGGGSMASGTGGASSSNAGTGGTGGCTPSAWYCDGDKDGFGDPSVMESACTAPPGNDMTCPGPYVANGNDCGPGDAMAYPGQTQYFSVQPMPPGPTPPFDYNCSGIEEKDPSQLYNGGLNLSCFMECIFNPNPPRGFGPNAVCGGTDEYYQCSFFGFGCTLMKVMPPEALRCH